MLQNIIPNWGALQANAFVMAGLVPAIPFPTLCARLNEMPGTRPGMTMARFCVSGSLTLVTD
ncbi:MAG TPA: hypothetical protein VFN27_00695 [Xanthobacteraceae bacterium]|nr:hypothetical protein [Xanthobacteraceae bacterium]